MHKQSVQDVERLFSDSLMKWMEDKGYLKETKYIHIICNWRRASDDQRCQFNDDLLCYILDDLMPWHKDEGLWDYSLLEDR